MTTPASCASRVVKKNTLRDVSDVVSHVVRSNPSPRARSPVRRVARVSGRVRAARGLPDVWPAVKQERLDWLASNPHYTKRFAWYVGHRCRSASIQEVASELRLDWHAVKAMEMEYMQAQLDVVGPPAPHVIGIDEISIRKGHVYRIIVSDLERAQPIWFGGTDRGEASMTMFYDFLGTAEDGRAPAGRDGHVETVSESDARPGTAGGNLVRQVSCTAATRQCARSGPEIRIQTPDESPRSALHQRAKVCVAIAS